VVADSPVGGRRGFLILLASQEVFELFGIRHNGKADLTGAEPGTRPVGRRQESTGQRPGSLDVALTAAVAYGTQTGDLVNRIRSIISVGAQQLFGLVVGHVDVEFVDVYPAAGTPR